MPEPSDAASARRRSDVAGSLRRIAYGLRTEGSGPVRETVAIACGVFIGCLPFYGFHFLLCWIVGSVFGLNRLKLYLAANISNPFVAPFLLFAEIQTGSWLRRGTFHPLTLEAARSTGLASLSIDLLLGSLVVGAVLAIGAGWATYATLGGVAARKDPFVELVRRASDRFVSMSVTAWEFARGKLRRDPVYRASVYDGLLHRTHQPRAVSAAPASAMLVDVGCGQGLMLALLAEVRRDVDAGRWEGPAPPYFARLLGVETRPRVASFARAALGDDAEILAADARSVTLPAADVILLFDVLHLMPADDQEVLLRALAASLHQDGVLVIRDADAAAGWRFAMVRAGNWLKAMAVGEWRQPFHFRSVQEWSELFARLGLRAELHQMGQGTPFGNVLFRVTRENVVV